MTDTAVPKRASDVRAATRYASLPLPLISEIARRALKKITVSLGVTSFRRSDNHMQNIIGRADQAFYRAKNNGHNRVEAE